MYFLPKVVVDDENEEPQEIDPKSPPEVVEAHDRELTDSEAELIADFKEGFKNQNNTEKSASFADSLAVLFANINLLDSAAFYLARAADLDPVPERFIKAGDGHYEAFSYAVELEEQAYWGAQAREFYQKALASDPDLLDVKAKMALTYLPQQPMQGVLLLREVIEKDEENELALYNLGLLSLQSNQFDKAIERFEALAKYHPDNLEGQFYLGVAYFQAEERDLAKVQFQKVKERDADPEVLETVEEYLKELK